MNRVHKTESLVHHGQTLQGLQCEALLLTTSFSPNNKNIFEMYRIGLYQTLYWKNCS
jgi:hypothetical protein